MKSAQAVRCWRRADGPWTGGLDRVRWTGAFMEFVYTDGRKPKRSNTYTVGLCEMYVRDRHWVECADSDHVGGAR